MEYDARGAEVVVTFTEKKRWVNGRWTRSRRMAIRGYELKEFIKDLQLVAREV